jgi:hypothetical protein
MAMPQISISEDTYARLKAFLPLGQYLNEEPVSLDDEGEVLILIGLQSLLRMLWEKLDTGTLIESLVKLSNRHPEQVYRFVADVLVAGGETADDIKQEFGFEQWRRKPN